MKVMLDKFLELIQRALDGVGQEYYAIPTTYEPHGIIRERVFCYELYHQMRLIQREQELNQFQIHGEIDKSGHKAFDCDSRKNPDFIFHTPGTMRNNMVVMEVKGNIEGRYRNDVVKDIMTLSKFTKDQHCYQLGVLVVYNYSLNDFRCKVSVDIATSLDCGISIEKIVLICKKNANKPCEVAYLSELLNGDERTSGRIKPKTNY